MIEKVGEKIKPKRGGKRPGSGRKPGTPNKATAGLKQLASEYTEEAVQVLVKVMRDNEAPAPSRIAAANSLLDRSHGKPRQEVEISSGKVDQALLQQIENEMMVRLEEARERQRQILIERGIINDA
ncbi:hypothetical protein [Methylomonas methanica]|uniref:DUF5681 domain-containing protein n=1 Tax=Methylomonas methanica (strain DSM 25384 / MC09) TaxID=857087 RepID=G0A3T1_METMM|nr:hypothetical protein [Methylomonas methanica]AEG02703.1 hypothetical protein Metme_4355 [Methylomonas methanica MC09]